MSTGEATLYGQRICAIIGAVTQLEEAAAAYRSAKQALDEARPHLAQAIVDAARAGTRQSEIVRVTGYTREQVRRICRAAGIEPK
jgi:F0F1-type ATP synthase membrane subunit b/b'